MYSYEERIRAVKPYIKLRTRSRDCSTRRRKQAGVIQLKEAHYLVRGPRVPGHWEGDLLRGSGSSQTATLVERQTGYVMISSKVSETVANALIERACKLLQELYKSLACDRGTEMASHKRFTVATDIGAYFCDPQHPLQRGFEREHEWTIETVLPQKVPTCRCIHRLNSTPWRDALMNVGGRL